jgi:hypothetical protein
VARAVNRPAPRAAQLEPAARLDPQRVLQVLQQAAARLELRVAPQVVQLEPRVA